MELARFQLLHFVSDWFRNPVFRQQFDAEPTDADRIFILREQYDFDESDLAVIASHDRKLLMADIARALDNAQPHRPDDWLGVTNAVTTGTRLNAAPSPGPAPGWPGLAWQCLETLSPSTVRVGKDASLVVEGWNIGDPKRFKLELGLREQTVELHDAERTVSATGRCIVRCAPVSIPSAGEWSLFLKKPPERHPERTPERSASASLMGALLVTD